MFTPEKIIFCFICDLCPVRLDYLFQSPAWVRRIRKMGLFLSSLIRWKIFPCKRNDPTIKFLSDVELFMYQIRLKYVTGCHKLKQEWTHFHLIHEEIPNLACFYLAWPPGYGRFSHSTLESCLLATKKRTVAATWERQIIWYFEPNFTLYLSYGRILSRSESSTHALIALVFKLSGRAVNCKTYYLEGKITKCWLAETEGIFH